MFGVAQYWAFLSCNWRPPQGKVFTWSTFQRAALLVIQDCRSRSLQEKDRSRSRPEFTWHRQFIADAEPGWFENLFVGQPIGFRVFGSAPKQKYQVEQKAWRDCDEQKRFPVFDEKNWNHDFYFIFELRRYFEAWKNESAAMFLFAQDADKAGERDRRVVLLTISRLVSGRIV